MQNNMTRFEINRIRSKMRQLDLSEYIIDRFLQKCADNLITYESALHEVDQWEKKNPSEFILQALACGAIAAVFGGWIALMSGLK